MPFVFLAVGILLLVIGVRGQTAAAIKLLQSEFTGSGSFIQWFLAIMFLGLVGYYRPAKPVADGMIGLVILAMIITNGRNGLFQNLETAFQNSPSIPSPTTTATAGTSTSTSATATGSGLGGQTGSVLGQLPSMIASPWFVPTMGGNVASALGGAIGQDANSYLVQGLSEPSFGLPAASPSVIQSIFGNTEGNSYGLGSPDFNTTDLAFPDFGP